MSKYRCAHCVYLSNTKFGLFIDSLRVVSFVIFSAVILATVLFLLVGKYTITNEYAAYMLVIIPSIFVVVYIITFVIWKYGLRAKRRYMQRQERAIDLRKHYDEWCVSRDPDAYERRNGKWYYYTCCE